MEGDFQEQLASLRRKIARIEAKHAAAPPAPRTAGGIEQWMDGRIVETPAGRHFETEKLFERHRRHGSMDISSLHELPADLLEQLSEGEIPHSPPARWAFLDTETTGLAGGTGTYAFLVGVGRICPEGFHLRQFFMRDYGEEPSLLAALAGHLAGFDVLITYNGKLYDQPLLETRYRMARARPPFGRLAHLDLLHGARRLWKRRLESCRLVELESRILGVAREGDLPGAMIPYVYFDYLRSGEAFRLAPVFHHNAIDILTLACLTGIVPFAFRSPREAPVTHGADLLGLARWLLKTGRDGQSLELLRRAVDLGLADELLFPTLWEIASLEKKRGGAAAALAGFTELAGCRNPFRVQAHEELAKHYEHRERNYVLALEFTRRALALESSPELRRREARLARRAAQNAERRMF